MKTATDIDTLCEQWHSTPCAKTRFAYARGLKEAGRYDDILRVYSPPCDPTNVQEFLTLTPLNERDQANIARLIRRIPGATLWYVNPTREKYEDVRLLALPHQNKNDWIDAIRTYFSWQKTICASPRRQGGASYNQKATGTYHGTAVTVYLCNDTSDEDAPKVRLA